MTKPAALPAHLEKYVVDQNYDRYTPIDQAVWRYILRLLVSHLKVHAHDVYESGLAKTGISVEEIPSIAEMSVKLEEFGWKAVPVSGFIPPAAFMEFQSLGYLPIASDMRSIEHAMYTPAPDIVHEAAGHAPIIADLEYAAYLKQYADVASHAIISHEDMAMYEAIRELSDIKEDPDSTIEDVDAAEKKLDTVSKNMTFVSEAAKLGRMNWWTAEYGLIGDAKAPKIFGAGLLSSPGESRTCLTTEVKKIELSADCTNYNYDITEPQPNLFVARDFKHLADVLEDFASTMAFRRGGTFGLDRAIEAKTVNTVELDTGLQLAGRLTNYRTNNDDIAYLQFEGPTQLCFGRKELPGHSKSFHSAGYGTAIGQHQSNVDMATCEEGTDVELTFESGVMVRGQLAKKTDVDNTLVLLTFENCTVTHGDDILFQPEWGVYDMALGTAVKSVFGGPADRLAYGEVDPFVAKIIPLRKYTDTQKKLHSLYQQVRDLRHECLSQNTSAPLEKAAPALIKELDEFEGDWLALFEMHEVFHNFSTQSEVAQNVEEHLKGMIELNAEVAQQINDGFEALAAMPIR